MKGNKREIAVMLILILALFMHMEGGLPNLFARSEEPIVLQEKVEGMEFKALIDSKGFTQEAEIVIKTIISNKSSQPIRYFAGTTSYGIRGVMGAALFSEDNKVKFTDKFMLDFEGASSNAVVLDGMLESGRELTCDFYMLPFYKDNGNVKYVTPGRYILSLWYNKGAGEVVKAEFPLTVSKRLGKMYIKSS